MDVPPPAAVAGRLTRALVARPYRVLRPFLTQASSPEEGVTGEVLTVVAGLVSFAVVLVGVLLAAGASVGYAVLYALSRLPSALARAVGR